MNKLASNKTSAIFLSIVLVAGTIALFSPLFMNRAQAKVESEYYGIDNNYEKSYRHDNYESTEYPFYKPAYKSEYQSYSEKDNYKSSKDSSNSVSINKLKEYVYY